MRLRGRISLLTAQNWREKIEVMNKLLKHKWFVLAILLTLYLITSYISISNEQMYCGRSDSCLGTRLSGKVCLGISYEMFVDCF